MAKIRVMPCFLLVTVWVCILTILVKSFMDGWLSVNRDMKNSPQRSFFETRSPGDAKQKWEPIDDKWIVITPKRLKTDLSELEGLTNVQGWSIVVVTQQSVSKEGRASSNVLLMGPEQIARSVLFSQTGRSPGPLNTQNGKDYGPFSQLWRRRIGVLCAMTRGAKFVFVTDDVDGKSISDTVAKFYLQNNKSILIADRTELFNQYGHFGQRSFLPKGLSSDSFQDKELTYSYRLLLKWNPPAMQNIVGYHQDSDIGQKRSDDPTFDLTAPPVMLETGTMAIFDVRNTLYAYNALWAAAVPMTSSPLVRREWASLWVQRLLWEINENVSFFPPSKRPPNLPQEYNIENETKPSQEIKELNSIHYNTTRLLQHLRDWSCQTKYSFFQCVSMASVFLARKGFWLQHDVEQTQQWLHDLKQINYTEPKRHSLPSGSRVMSKKITSKSNISAISKLGPDEITSVKFVSSYEVEFSINQSRNQFNKTVYFEKMREVCKTVDVVKRIDSSLNKETKSLNFFSDILLLIVFNHPHYEVIGYLEETYRPLFTNIVYCGDDMGAFGNATRNLYPFLTFLDVDVGKGFFGPKCLGRVLEMGYDVTGYLQIGDDDLVKWWNLLSFDKNKIWRDFNWRFLDPVKTKELWWNSSWGKKPYGKAFKELNSTEHKDSDVISHREFLSRFYRNTFTGLVKGMADILYIPNRLRLTASYYLRLFFKHGLFLELVCPILIRGIEEKQNVIDMNITNLWQGQRLKPEEYYNSGSNIIALHPVKLSTPKGQKLFCGQYVHDLVTKLYS